MWRSYVICVLIGLLLVSTGGNVRDYSSAEGYPFLDSTRGLVNDESGPASVSNRFVGTDPSTDSRFLRYPATTPVLPRFGLNGAPVGVPPVKE